MEQAVFQIKQFWSLLKQRELFFSSNNFLGTVFFGSLQFYLLKKQSQIQTNKKTGKGFFLSSKDTT